MGVLSDLEPKSVFRFFEEIAGIPHGSGNVGRISDYLAGFARERGLFHIQDALKNVIIVKEAAPGYEQEPAVILQGHMDMVAVKKPGCELDMAAEGLRIAAEGDRIYAEGTSLGGDDGIALAYCLALLDSDAIRHPKLEVIFTVDEEVGMDGARGIDLSMLTGSRMINLDSEEEGIFLTSCAGGARVKCSMPMKDAPVPISDGQMAVRVTAGGLLGGHSGAEIHKERGNSNCIFGRLLARLCGKMQVCLAGVRGGLADNAIPRETAGILVIERKDSEEFAAVLDMVEKEIQTELAVKDPGVYIRAEACGQRGIVCASARDTERAACFLCALPDGVQAMSADIHGLVETSLNLGILEYESGQACGGESSGQGAAGSGRDTAGAAAGSGGESSGAGAAGSGRDTAGAAAGSGGESSGAGAAALSAEFSVRSSVESAKRALIGKVQAVTKLAGGSSTVSGDYPGWSFRKDSPLREKMIRLYEEMYGTRPKVEAIHAGLECGLLGSKIADLDCVSIGPDMRDIHTTEETLSISSTKRVWEYLVRLLETKDAC